MCHSFCCCNFLLFIVEFFCGACSVLCPSWGAIKSSPEVGKFLQTSGIVIEDPDALGGFHTK